MNKNNDKNAKPDRAAVQPDESVEENTSQSSMPASANPEGLHGLDQILAPSEEILEEAMERGFYRFRRDELEHQEDKVDQ